MILQSIIFCLFCPDFYRIFRGIFCPLLANKGILPSVMWFSSNLLYKLAWSFWRRFLWLNRIYPDYLFRKIQYIFNFFSWYFLQYSMKTAFCIEGLNLLHILTNASICCTIIATNTWGYFISLWWRVCSNFAKKKTSHTSDNNLK